MTRAYFPRHFFGKLQTLCKLKLALGPLSRADPVGPAGVIHQSATLGTCSRQTDFTGLLLS